MSITSYRDLDAWQVGMTLAEAVYDVTENFPARERYGLAAQLRRSASGIPSNVAEGHQMGTRSYHH
jgi:four helix bundle protein